MSTSKTFESVSAAFHRGTGIDVNLRHVAQAECEVAETALRFLQTDPAEAEKYLKDLLSTHKTLAKQNSLG